MSAAITAVHARQILDCRGYPTVQVDVWAGAAPGEPGAFHGRAAVPSGRSTGAAEAVELRDGGAAYRGFGVTRAVANVNEIVGPAVAGRDVTDQAGLDALLRDLDGTPRKARLGANALAGVSLAAACRCTAR